MGTKIQKGRLKTVSDDLFLFHALINNKNLTKIKSQLIITILN
ncbi:hypothetical protein MCC93_09470 [Morococcus cerebrosus]|uniref:Uncharacterized protein n=1 Tax=Morococcus cerebrosus TaxID=1056807 RepID=A0A0C1H4L6_9NEIS|nr:hypothetical protein MCC93_09470 [Morococcus cerebrosus]